MSDSTRGACWHKDAALVTDRPLGDWSANLKFTVSSESVQHQQPIITQHDEVITGVTYAHA